MVGGKEEHTKQSVHNIDEVMRARFSGQSFSSALSLTAHPLPVSTSHKPQIFWWSQRSHSRCFRGEDEGAHSFATDRDSCRSKVVLQHRKKKSSRADRSENTADGSRVPPYRKTSSLTRLSRALVRFSSFRVGNLSPLLRMRTYHLRTPAPATASNGKTNGKRTQWFKRTMEKGIICTVGNKQCAALFLYLNPTNNFLPARFSCSIEGHFCCPKAKPIFAYTTCL